MQFRQRHMKLAGFEPSSVARVLLRLWLRRAGVWVAQLLSGKAGEFWVIGSLAFRAQDPRALGRVVKMADSSEKPPGQWNRMTIRVLDGTVDVKVNAVRQNTDSDCPRTPGHIALQTEGNAIELRNIQLRPLGK